jgi:hypothetical protein
MRSVEDIIAEGGQSLERLIREAYEAGVEKGRAVTTEELGAKLSTIFGPAFKVTMGRGLHHTMVTVGVAEPDNSAAAEPTGRAAPGTVKPAVLSLINQSGASGLTTDEIVDMTGFKTNSVRGTLWTLQDQKAIGRIGDRWMSAEVILKAGFAASTENPGAASAGAD